MIPSALPCLHLDEGFVNTVLPHIYIYMYSATYYLPSPKDLREWHVSFCLQPDDRKDIPQDHELTNDGRPWKVADVHWNLSPICPSSWRGAEPCRSINVGNLV